MIGSLSNAIGAALLITGVFGLLVSFFALIFARRWERAAPWFVISAALTIAGYVLVMNTVPVP